MHTGERYTSTGVHHFYTPEELQQRRHASRQEAAKRATRVRRIGAAVGAIAATTLLALGANEVRKNMISENFTCDRSELILYTGNTAGEAARQIPGVQEHEINPYDVTLQQTKESKPLPARSFEYTFDGSIYGPVSCDRP